jgi:ankyrin repeat protein
VKALLEADPTLLESKDDQLSYRGNTPLISACWGWASHNPQLTTAVANFLIDKGANIHTKNNNGGTPLYFALRDFDLTQRLIATWIMHRISVPSAGAVQSDEVRG